MSVNYLDYLLTQMSLLMASTSAGVQYNYDHFFNIKKKLLDKQKKGEHKGIRYVTIIDNDNINLVKAYLNSGIQIRHVRNLPPMGSEFQIR